MNKTITVNTQTIQTILSRLDQLTRDIKVMKERLFELEPEYGSDVWWDKQIEESGRDFKKGKGIKFNSVKEAIKWLDS